jgi:hypothetical protein
MLPIGSRERSAFDKYHAGSLGKELANKKHCIKAVYDFAVLGGAIGSVSLVDQYGETVKIPLGAIVTQVLVDTVTPLTSGGLATVALTLNAAGDLMAADDFDDLVAIMPGIPVGSAATAVKATAEREIVATIAVAALTAGKVDVYLEVLHTV